MAPVEKPEPFSMSAKLPDTVPLPAQNLLDFIGDIEAPGGYDVIFGNRHANLPVPLTKMNYGDVVEAQANWGNKSWVKKNWGFNTSSSAAGRYQFMRATLIGIAKEIPEITGKFQFDSTLQNKLGYYLLLRRGYENFIAGRMSVSQFGLNLAKEWASFPVLAGTQGDSRPVTRGQSYYAGDGLNKALVKPDVVERRLAHVLELVQLLREDGSKKSPVPPKAEPIGSGTPAAPAVPVENVDPEKLDKPLAKSKTVWQWILTFLGAAAAAFGGLDWRLQILIVLAIGGSGVYAIKRRADIAKVYRDIKAEFDA